MRFTRLVLPVVFALGLPVAALAHHYELKGLKVGHIWGLAAGQTVNNLQVYVPIENTNTVDDTLTSASVDGANAEFKLDDMHIDNVKLPAGKTSELMAGGVYIAVSGLKKAVKDGDTFPLTLHFEKAGELKTSVHVQAHEEGADAHDSMEGMDHGTLK